MAGKLDYEKSHQERRIATNGYEPISKDYAEFPSKYRTKPNSSKRPGHPDRIDGLPNPRNPKVRHRYLTEIEKALRRGEQPIVPANILRVLAAEIKSIGLNPEVRKAYHDALKKRSNRKPRSW